jgi:uridine kinase
MSKPVIIGIAGGSASGKTSVAEILRDAYAGNKSVVIIRQDDYYKDQSHMEFSERLKTNYDHPFAFDNDLLIKQLDELIAGNKIDKPTYDYVHHTRSDITEEISPADVIVLEGLFVLQDEAIRKKLDMKIYIDTDADIRFIRRLKRDVKERGRTLENVCDQYMTTVRVMHNAFVEPSKKYADIIIPEGSHNVVAIDLLMTKISSIVEKNLHENKNI